MLELGTMFLNLRRYGAGLAILQAAMLISSCGQSALNPAPDNQTAPAPVPKRIEIAGPERVILAFGDSLYAGYRLAPGESLPAELETQLRAQGINARVVNAGVSGDTSAAARARLTFTLDKMQKKPDLVLLGLGGNDVLRQIPVEETRANLTAMLDELKRRKIPIILTGMLAPPNLGPDYASSFNSIWPDLAKTYKAPLDPFILAGVLGNRALMLDDGIHPNAMGVDKIAQRLAPIVKASLPTD
jgi:acyl-CoA thioesterase I